MAMLILLAVVGYFAYRCTTSEDRARLVEAIVSRTVAKIRRTRVAADKTRAAGEPFRQALRERMQFPIATASLVALNVLMFVLMLKGDGSLSDPETLIGWGASVGTRTTNGEWWRLVFSCFIHTGLLSLIVNMAALIQIGLILERLVGRAAFAMVYVASGIFAGLWAVSSYPIAVSMGSSGSVFGLYGMLLATWVWSLFPATAVTMPLVVAKQMAPLAAIFTLYNLFSGSLPFAAELTGFVIGIVGGAALAKGVDEGAVPPHRAAPAGVATLVIAFVCAVPLRGIADVRPEIAHVVAVEDQTTSAYQTAVDKFKHGRMTADGLAQVIDRMIVPQLQATDSRLKALKRVPPEHQGLVADAEEYVRLRSESWRLRAESLRRSTIVTTRRVTKTEQESDTSFRVRAESQYRGNLLTMAKAEGTERASLEVLQRIKTGS